MVLLTGKMMSFQDTRRLLNGGEAFLLMLQQFRVEDVTVSTFTHPIDTHPVDTRYHQTIYTHPIDTHPINRPYRHAFHTHSPHPHIHPPSCSTYPLTLPAHPTLSSHPLIPFPPSSHPISTPFSPQDARLHLAESYADNPVFRPKNVEPVSLCAAKFCAWVLGVVQAARWHRGLGHRRTDPLDATPSYPHHPHSQSGRGGGQEGAEVPFHQKLAKEKAKLTSRRRQQQQQQQAGEDGQGTEQGLKISEKSGGKFSSLLRSISPPTSSSSTNHSMSMNALNQPVPQFPPVHTLSQSHYPLQQPNRSTTPSGRDSHRTRKGDRDKETSLSQSHLTKRQVTRAST